MNVFQPAHAWPSPHGEQVIEIVADHGYRPQSIVARAGVPLRLVFRRCDDDVCMDRIVFSSPHLDRRLARGSVTTIVLPAQAAGEIRFTCGMGRYHGQIELRPGQTHALVVLGASAAGRLRRAWRHISGDDPTTVEQERGRASECDSRKATLPRPSNARGDAPMRIESEISQ